LPWKEEEEREREREIDREREGKDPLDRGEMPMNNAGESKVGSAARSRTAISGGVGGSSSMAGAKTRKRSGGRAGSAASTRQAGADILTLTRPSTGMSHISMGNGSLDRSFASAMSENLSSVDLLRQKMERMQAKQSAREQALKLGLQDSALWYTRRNLPAKTDDYWRGRSIRKDGTVNRVLALFKGVVQVVMCYVRSRL
jgi:hypothetical protein